MDANLLQTLIGAGPVGAVAVVSWLLLKQLREVAADRLQYDRDRLETDKKLVAALTTLAMKITGHPHDLES